MGVVRLRIFYFNQLLKKSIDKYVKIPPVIKTKAKNVSIDTPNGCCILFLNNK